MFPPVAQTSIEAFWRGRNRRFALALHNDVLLFWEPDSPQFQNAPQEWVFAVDYHLCFSDEGHITPQLLSSELEWALANNRVGRRFQLADTLTVFLHGDHRDYGAMNSSFVFRLGGTEKWAKFEGGDGGAPLFDWDASRWIELLENEALDGPYGYDFFGDVLSHAEIPFAYGAFGVVAHFNPSCGTVEEMKTGADLIFQLAPEWIEEAISRPRWDGNVELRVVLHIHKPPRYLCGYGHKDGGLISVPHPHAELWNVWLNYFGPRLDTVFHHSDIEEGVRVFSLSFMPSVYPDLMDSVDNRLPRMSQHEQLEIRLQLRDWLRDHVGLPEQRIAELLA